MPAKNNESRDGEFYINEKAFKFKELTIVPEDEPPVPLNEEIDFRVTEYKFTLTAWAWPWEKLN